MTLRKVLKWAGACSTPVGQTERCDFRRWQFDLFQLQLQQPAACGRRKATQLKTLLQVVRKSASAGFAAGALAPDYLSLNSFVMMKVFIEVDRCRRVRGQ